MRHILFIDPLEKLNFKKDSTFMLAHNLKESGIEVYLLFEADFYLVNNSQMALKVYNFSSKTKDGFYLENFELKEALEISLNKNDVIHMRIDPPFDTRYLRYLWMLRFYQQHSIKVINNPDGILKFNEKLHAYSQKNSLPSYVGSSETGFLKFVQSLTDSTHLILKPLDLYQGYGVEKVDKNSKDLLDIFKKKVLENKGSIVAQPFNKEVEKGEIRSLYFKGIELGSILKVPKSGEFLANIAQGASFHAIELSPEVKSDCDLICADLLKEGVDWVAFDIMGNNVSEVNITCPGLLVEVSYAHKKNFAKTIIENM
jgi:glutathione synthase